VESNALLAEPVFIVCTARSGSTLLRYLLDAHPDIACPPETKIPFTAQMLMNVHADLTGNTVTELKVKKHGPQGPAPESLALAREVIGGMITEYLASRGKSVWCDKSLETVLALDVIRRLFPGARFICLHRHAMDVVASLHESCTWGYGYFTVQPYIARHYNNVPLAFAEYWMDREARMAGLEDSSARTLAVHYERLVRDPETVVTDILRFLDLPREDKLVRRMVESALGAADDSGAGDWKIPFTTAVDQRSVERGRAIPVELIGGAPRATMNKLLARMRYPVVGDDWNTSSSIAPEVDRGLLAAGSAADRTELLVNGLMAPRLADFDGPAVRELALCVTYGDGQSAQWIINGSGKTIRRDEARGQAALTVTTRAEVLQAILTGGLSSETALRLEMLKITGAADEAERQALGRFLNALLIP
jgi:protein-tyrosine sulfotransferase